MQYPTKETKWRWCMRLIISTSALNSLSPWLPAICSCLTATSLPSGSDPLYTQPNPPSPKRFWVEKLFVAFISSSYANNGLELPSPDRVLPPEALCIRWAEERIINDKSEQCRIFNNFYCLQVCNSLIPDNQLRVLHIYCLKSSTILLRRK